MSIDLSFSDLDHYTLPALDLLTSAPKSSHSTIDKAMLERNARLLEGVLHDFKINSTVVEVRPGPVVTTYEVALASGVKASRLIALADDIARSMSAVSASVAMIPGRGVIGIEVANERPQTVTLHELVASQSFEEQAAQLAIILGKDVAGEPVIADLAPMSHLLVAGTTGSGKSVGLNCMILSLLYRMAPDQCRMIMIDPRVLELSSYDGIPHLLAPVVTDPAKAVHALTWVAAQMEDRYRLMTSVGVRNLTGFNDKVRAATARGEPLGRKVQTGYHPETGQPVYLEEQLDFQVMPPIVVIVDELADVLDGIAEIAGTDTLSSLLHRISERGNVAGIYMILASNRWAVENLDYFTGAEVAARIAYALASDGETEEFLGQTAPESINRVGDMLYLPSGRKVVRIHGAFVSDDDVRAVADHWRSQGSPEFADVFAEEPEDDGFSRNSARADDGTPEAALYRTAVQVVAEAQKASASFVRRQLRIGYSQAAQLIERMEREGKVGASDHIGRREVFVDRDGRAVRPRCRPSGGRKTSWWQWWH